MWLAEAPRRLTIHVDRQLPVAELRSRDYKVGKRVGKGALYGTGTALAGIGELCLEAFPVGCVVGVAVSPVMFVGGAIYGAASVDSVDSYLYRLDADRTLTEFAPYLLAAGGENGLKSVAGAKGYPTGGESEWVTRSAPSVREQVTVPAGTFRALRFELHGRRRIPPFSSISVQRFEVRVWYAPEVKRYVRLEHRSWLSSRRSYAYDVVELLEYHRPTRNLPRGG